MPYIPPEVIEQARQIDLLTYLRRLEPDNVEEVKGTRNVYRTVDHDSLKDVQRQMVLVVARFRRLYCA